MKPIAERAKARKQLTDLIHNMRRKRIGCGMSCRQLAKQLNTSYSTLCRLERGIGKPSDDTRLRINAFLDGDDALPPRSDEQTMRRPHWLVKLEQRLTDIEGSLEMLMTRMDERT